MAVGGSLAAEHRRAALRDTLESSGQVRLDEAAERFEVHPMTVRRDLQVLEREGVARLVRGGATLVGPEEFERRQARALTAKRRIAAKLLPLVPEHEAIGLDASTTVFELANRLDDAPGLVVVTYGQAAFQVLQPIRGVTSYLTGGEQDRRTTSLVGPIAQRSVASFSLARCFLSAAALDPATGATEPTFEESEMKQAVADASAHVVLAVDATKLGRRSLVRSLAWDHIDLLVTELDPSDPRLDPFREQVELR